MFVYIFLLTFLCTHVVGYVLHIVPIKKDIPIFPSVCSVKKPKLIQTVKEFFTTTSFTGSPLYSCRTFIRSSVPESCAISRRKKRKLKVIMHPEELLLLHTQVQNV